CKPRRCGDNITQEGETCDDGNQNNTDACKNDCQKPACGDSLESDGEACEDGNTNDGDGCSSECQLEARCGDGTKNGSEECDDGNQNDTQDACTNQCKELKPLNELNPSCSESNITFTLCMTAATNWCKAFGSNPGVITGKPNANQDRYEIACLENVQKKTFTVDAAFSKSGGDCPGGQQQFPKCVNAVTRKCKDEGFTFGFYTGLTNNDTQLQAACGHAREASVEAGSIGNGCTISESSKIDLACTAAIAKRCRDAGDGKTGMIVGVDGTKVDYVCLTGTIGVAEFDR
ncbi:MAG: DUF4215 domain-containing protein, partial [Myxococcota bacterium]|nr:DUF4215 domain-containing protein [Myxococcota bacterium]